ncbi:DUF1801 domain-containing protein [Dyadobacter pollutisoli]|uniref:DUF1801 domain-containing protein n=1 Tax=Dyadobacter pollutisoli TaxID=2910158 RepID=A0A9E8SM51_9BACT|nr:DUF1801 domain-containing protein [Dyadobacter pollutisoli]WAC09407.1 DUF1801 domain-containing protein [Dyadobacter pollutisoli]
MKEIDQFFMNKPEPARSCMSALRHLILKFDMSVAEIWRYSMPFYTFEGKRFCYIWVEKKTGRPYIGIVDGKLIEHPFLIAEKRTRMKIIPIDPAEDLPLELIYEIFQQAINAVKR